MPSWLRWALAVLTTYRLAALVAKEEGPALIFTRLREAAGAYEYGENGEPVGSLGRGIVCPLCVGMYAALLMVVLLWRPTRIGDLFLGWVGISGAQAFLERGSA